MEQPEMDKLRYRRQYILAPKPVTCNFLHTEYQLTKTIRLYAHIDLNVTTYTASGIKLVLLGDLFDYEYIQKSNADLLKDAIDSDYTLFLENTSKYTGRFVIVYIKDDMLSLVTDAAASRKVYYCRSNEGVYCASQPHLLAATLNLNFTKNTSKLLFYGSNEFKSLGNTNIGNTTCYDEIFQLIPNHFLDYNGVKTVRFWPNQKIKSLPLEEVVNICSKIIKGYIESIGNRYKLMLPVTAGKDSRLLLSATFDIKNEVFYYINKESRLSDDSNDITIPKSLLGKLELDFHIVDPYIKIDDNFRKIYFENNPLGNEKFLPIIYNYYVNFSDKINLPGIFVNVVEDVYEVFGKDISPRSLSELIHVERFDYAETYFSEWLDGAMALCKHHNLNILNLLYWEERIANWGTQLQLDKDIAQEDIIPYNSRLLMQTMLSADLKYREKPHYVIFREITRMLWPETLQAPCNPDFKSEVLKFSKSFGILKIIKNIYYRFRN